MTDESNSERLTFFLEPTVPLEYTIEINRQSLDAIRNDPSIATDILHAIGLDTKMANRVVDNLTCSSTQTSSHLNTPHNSSVHDDCHVQSLDAYIVRRTLTPTHPIIYPQSSLEHTTSRIEECFEGPSTQAITPSHRLPSQRAVAVTPPDTFITESEDTNIIQTPHPPKTRKKRRLAIWFCCNQQIVVY